jgi:hypothetical protein
VYLFESSPILLVLRLFGIALLDVVAIYELVELLSHVGSVGWTSPAAVAAWVLAGGAIWLTVRNAISLSRIKWVW